MYAWQCVRGNIGAAMTITFHNNNIFLLTTKQDIDKDPYELTNIYPTLPASLQQHLRELMLASYYCGGTFTSQSNCTKPFPDVSLFDKGDMQNNNKYVDLAEHLSV